MEWCTWKKMYCNEPIERLTILLILTTFVYTALEMFHLGQIQKNFIPSVMTVLINPLLLMWRSVNVYAVSVFNILKLCCVPSCINIQYTLIFLVHSLWCLCSVSVTCVYVPICVLFFLIEASVSESHTSESNWDFSYIIIYFLVYVVPYILNAVI